MTTAALTRALQRFDEENARDPHLEIVDGIPRPREWLYAQRLAAWVERLAPEASAPLRLAARCQHICRWKIPRDTYPMTRPGYLKWRQDLKEFHAKLAGEILRETGCDEDTMQKVRELNLKKNFPADPESRILEDALCLVFLEFQFAELAARTDEAKIINAVQKTWKKMTPAAHARALALPLGPRELALVQRALAPAAGGN
ncbi:MAG TPA: DUF4202 domain-containing protein [Verrucomicrobiae bacterium]|jgi:hypothetical protein|nr:DUF4202 domain-containing protein [Verrucomicrobiae bacterium]